MNRSRSSTRLTYADFVQFPDDGLRHEIIDGEHYVTPSPAIRHQRIALNLTLALGTFLAEQAIGELFIAPTDVVLSDSDIVVPDLLYVSHAHADRVNEKNVWGAPDLAVEILSPSTRSRDLRLKRDAYERTGVGEYWIVDPVKETLTVYRRDGDQFVEVTQLGNIVETPLLPGFAMPVSRIFQEPARP